MDDTIARLVAEGDSLDSLVADLDEHHWRLATPAAGWTIAHQIGHLLWTDEIVHLAMTDRDRFAAIVAKAIATPTVVDDEATRRAGWSPARLLAGWRAGRDRLATALTEVAPGDRIPWFGPAMSPRSMATARIMETWAHGRDVADALGVVPAATERLRDVAHIGIRTRDFSFRIHGFEPPPDEFRIELTAPDGDTWTWGPTEASQRVTGSAEAFCLVVTQRRGAGDVDVTAHGPDATRWLGIAQAFAGPATSFGVATGA